MTDSIKDGDKVAPCSSTDRIEERQSHIKKVKLTDKEDISLKNLPSCEAYERSYMHRDHVTHVFMTSTQFLVTASADGVIKFWKKNQSGIEFVKTFRSHTGPIEDMSVTQSGSELVSISRKDKTVKVFDMVNFDMINMFSLDFEPKCVEWIDETSMSVENLVISNSKSHEVYSFYSRQFDSEPKRKINTTHQFPVCRMRLNPKNNLIVSIDTTGIVKYWRVKNGQCDRIKHPNATPEHDTVIHDFILPDDSTKARIRLHNINFSPDGDLMVTTSSDRKVRLFKMKSGKLVREYDESLERIGELQKLQPVMNNMDFARRMAIERELDRTQATSHEVAIFDRTGQFVLYPTMLGVKVWHWRSNKLVKYLGREETNFRPLCLALFQGLVFDKMIRRINAYTLESGVSDPTLYCTSFKKNRFYCFSNRHFEEDAANDESGPIKDRDIFNEKPTREEVMAAIEIEQQQKVLNENATIHTTMGDIHLKLYTLIAPKACENFCTHSKNNYYNNHIFHRVIKQFMIQTGDPTGTGTGGESIWDLEFEDEFSEELKHDKPFMLSMANCGPNTNGSQFFITVAPCTFLDNKHTIFGRVTRGMDVCQKISKVKTDPKTDKPYDDIKIININVF